MEETYDHFPVEFTDSGIDAFLAQHKADWIRDEARKLRKLIVEQTQLASRRNDAYITLGFFVKFSSEAQNCVLKELVERMPTRIVEWADFRFVPVANSGRDVDCTHNSYYLIVGDFNEAVRQRAMTNRSFGQIFS